MKKKPAQVRKDFNTRMRESLVEAFDQWNGVGMNTSDLLRLGKTLGLANWKARISDYTPSEKFEPTY